MHTPFELNNLKALSLSRLIMVYVSYFAIIYLSWTIAATIIRQPQLFMLEIIKEWYCSFGECVTKSHRDLRE